MIWNENQIDEQFYPGPHLESVIGGHFSTQQFGKMLKIAVAASSTMSASIHGAMTVFAADFNKVNANLNHIHINLASSDNSSDHSLQQVKYRENPPHPMAPSPGALVYDRRGRKRY